MDSCIVCTGDSGYNGNLIFGTDGNSTRDNSASNITERVRIDSNGNFIVNVTTAAQEVILINHWYLIR